MKQFIYEYETPLYCECGGEILEVFYNNLPTQIGKMREFEYFICQRCKTKYSSCEYEIEDGRIIKYKLIK